MSEVTFMIEEELRRLDEQMRELRHEGRLTKCRCGWPRMTKRLEDGSVVQFCNNRECPDFSIPPSIESDEGK